MAISGYADFLSTQRGASLNLYVSTDAPKFRVEFYRLSVTLAGPLAGMPSLDICDGQNVAATGCPDDWGWPAYAFTIPQDWQIGVHIAMLVEVDANGVDTVSPINRSIAAPPTGMIAKHYSWCANRPVPKTQFFSKCRRRPTQPTTIPAAAAPMRTADRSPA